AGIANLDSQLPRLQDMLAKAGLWDDAILVVTADHGEALGEQGGFNHGYSPFDHQYHVPLLFHCPRRWPAGRQVTTTVGHIGFKPTLLSLAGVKSTAFMQGHSYVPLMDGAPPKDAGFAYCEGVKFHFALKAAYEGNNKIICDAKHNKADYFDVSRDPLE